MPNKTVPGRYKYELHKKHGATISITACYSQSSVNTEALMNALDDLNIPCHIDKVRPEL